MEQSPMFAVETGRSQTHDSAYLHRTNRRSETAPAPAATNRALEYPPLQTDPVPKA